MYPGSHTVLQASLAWSMGVVGFIYTPGFQEPRNYDKVFFWLTSRKNKYVSSALFSPVQCNHSICSDESRCSHRPGIVKTARMSLAWHDQGHHFLAVILVYRVSHRLPHVNVSILLLRML